MQFLTHVVVAFGLSVFGTAHGIFIPAWGYFLLLLGSVFPDIDLYLPIIGHRTWTHSLLIVCAGLVIGVWIQWLFWFFLGVLIHIVLDSLTKQGIYVQYPLPIKLRGFCRTGGFCDWILCIGSFVYCVSVCLTIFF
jgi:membrane-bound metal-dependent hydrolase YbcI (DUF457 family)